MPKKNKRIKKCVIAAAGRGTRMKHLTNYKPKHLIKVCDKPFLLHLINNIKKAGYDELIIVVGYRASKIEHFLERNNIKAKLVNQYDIMGKRRYGTLCALRAVENVVKNDNFIMVYADNFYSVKDLKNFNEKDEFHYIGGFEHENPNKYGVLVSNDGFLKRIKEKPKADYGKLINTGLYKFTPEIFKIASKVKLSKRKEYELTDAISLLAKDKKVKIKKIEDYWLDFGNPVDIMKLSSFLHKNGNCKK